MVRIVARPRVPRPLLDAGEGDWLVSLFIRARHSTQLILGPLTHTVDATHATENGDDDHTDNNTNDSANAGAGV